MGLNLIDLGVIVAIALLASKSRQIQEKIQKTLTKNGLLTLESV